MNNLKEIQESLTPEQIIKIVTDLGSDEYMEYSDYIQFKTICHNADPSNASLKLYYYKNSHLFVCYTECGDSFNIFELFRRRYEILGQPYDFYKDIVLKIAKPMQLTQSLSFNNIYESDFYKYKKNQVEVSRTFLNPSLLNCFIFHPVSEWINDGISVEAMKYYNIKYSISQNKIIIPHYDYDGNLIGIRARALNEEDVELGKYMPIQIEGKILSHSLAYNLYGLNFVKNNIKKLKMAIVSEGEKSPMLYYSMFGSENNICVAVCGSNFHNYQFELLRMAGAEKILIAFDKEGKNWKEQQQYYLKLKKLCEKYKNRVQIGFIWDTDNLLQLKDSPFDRGKKTFLQLYNQAIWIS